MIRLPGGSSGVIWPLMIVRVGSLTLVTYLKTTRLEATRNLYYVKQSIVVDNNNSHTVHGTQ